jgi:hypothetical protein
MTFQVLNHHDMLIPGDEQFRINSEHYNDQIIRSKQKIEK